MDTTASKRRYECRKHSAPVRTGRAVGLALLATALPAGVLAQAIDTNRPGFSFSPGVIAAGRWQFETGLAYARIGADAEALSLPNAEIRYGVGAGTEVFLAGFGWSDVDAGGTRTRGIGDVGLGTKIALDVPGPDTRMALLFLVSAPVGRRGLSSERWDASLGLVWSHAGSLPLAGTIRVTDLDAGVQIDNGLKLPWVLDDRRSVFLEWEANIPENGGSRHWLNSGFQWLVSDDIQLDLGAAVGLNDRAGDYRLGFGFSIRL